jgi:hypothetical protein
MAQPRRLEEWSTYIRMLGLTTRRAQGRRHDRRGVAGPRPGGPPAGGSRAGTGCELRINSILHVNSRLERGTVVPIGWIATGDPAQLFSPDRHDELWAAQEPLDFPGTVYGVDRGTSMREIMRRQSEAYAPKKA